MHAMTIMMKVMTKKMMKMIDDGDVYGCVCKGKPIRETRAADLPLCIDHFR